MGFDSPASLACWYTLVWDDTVFDGLVGISPLPPLHSPFWGACHSSQTQKTSYYSLFIVGLFVFLSHDEMTLAVSKDELCFIKHRDNQIVVTIGAL